MIKVYLIAIILATAYSQQALSLAKEELLPATDHACAHDHKEHDPLADWKAKYVPNPFMTMEEHIESYRDQSLKATLLNAEWKGLRVHFDYFKLDLTA